MEANFWTYVAIPVLVGIVILAFEYLVIQPVVKKLERNQKEIESGLRAKKKKENNLLNNNIFRKTISFWAKISPLAIIMAIIIFSFGVAFTILVAKVTNTNLTDIGTSGIDPLTGIDTHKCGLFHTGIVGQVNLGSRQWNYNNISITTSPPTNATIPDDKGYFSICDIPVSNTGQKYTIKATTSTECYKGAVDITVFSRKTTIAIVNMIYDYSLCPSYYD